MRAVYDIFSKWNKDAKYELAKTGVVWGRCVWNECHLVARSAPIFYTAG